MQFRSDNLLQTLGFRTEFDGKNLATKHRERSKGTSDTGDLFEAEYRVVKPE
jgi:hypothetical protein